MSDHTDSAKDIRRGEELDHGKVETFIRDMVPGVEGEMTIRQFPRGHSNLTYLISFGQREMVLRRPPHGTKAKTAHDMNREYRVLSALQPVYPYGPRPLAYTEDPSIMGCPFYLMERIKGIILRRELPPGLAFSARQVRQLFEELVKVHYALHSVDYHAVGLTNFGKPEGYVKRQVKGWSDRYRKAKTPDAPDCEEIMTWLADHMPPESATPGVIHNDFKFDNVVLDPSNPMKIIGVLDWEMATLGDPLMDIGCSLGYWVEPNDPEEMQLVRFMPTHLEGALTRKEMLRYYAELSGCRFDHFEFYCCYGLFRLAVIVQQIYYRYYHGQTQDHRFKDFVGAVGILDRAALRMIR